MNGVRPRRYFRSVSLRSRTALNSEPFSQCGHASLSAISRPSAPRARRSPAAAVPSCVVFRQVEQLAGLGVRFAAFDLQRQHAGQQFAGGAGAQLDRARLGIPALDLAVALDRPVDEVDRVLAEARRLMALARRSTRPGRSSPMTVRISEMVGVSMVSFRRLV